MNNKSRVNHQVHLSYRDVLLRPYSDDFCSIESRHDPDISTSIAPGVKLQTPLISSPMDSITGPRMAIALARCGALGILTRYINDKDEHKKQLADVATVRQHTKGPVAVAIGVKDNSVFGAESLCEAGATIICLDIANGNHKFMQHALHRLQRNLPESTTLIAGNVACGEAAVRLADCGAQCIKIGIGPGAVCSTRRVTGFGVPQFTAILDCAEALDIKGYNDVGIIADGGLRHPGDAAKAIWAGANAVMAGYIFAGHNECPQIDGEFLYRGMSSRNVSRRNDIAAEGICVQVSKKGPVATIVKEWSASIKAACSMANAKNLEELRRNVEAIRVSTMSNSESDPVSGE